MKYLHRLFALDSRILLALIILAGMVLQLFTLFVLFEPNSLNWPDPKLYYSIAQQLVNGEPFSTATNTDNLIVSPGYPLFLSGIIYLFGNSVLTIRIIFILLFPLFIITVFQIGKKLKNESLGLIFSLMCIIYPYYIYIPLTLYSESITIYLFPLFLLLTMRLRESFKILDAILLALVSGFLIFSRPTSVYLIPISLLYLFWHNVINLRRILISGITVAVPVILVLFWMGRNKVVHNEYMFSMGGSSVLYQSYNEGTVPGKKRLPVFSEELKKELDKAPTDLEETKIMNKFAKKFIKENPGKSIKIAFYNILNYWNPIPLTFGEQGESMEKYKIIPAFFYSLFLILGIIGYFHNKKLLLANTILLLLVFNTMLNAPFMVSVRYRVIVDFGFILFASYSIQLVYEKFILKKSGLNS